MASKMSATRRRTIERDAETRVLKSQRDVEDATTARELDETLAQIAFGNKVAARLGRR